MIVPDNKGKDSRQSFYYKGRLCFRASVVSTLNMRTAGVCEILILEVLTVATAG